MPEDAMEKNKVQLRYATKADEKSTMYLQWAANALEKIAN